MITEARKPEPILKEMKRLLDTFIKPVDKKKHIKHYLNHNTTYEELLGLLRYLCCGIESIEKVVFNKLCVTEKEAKKAG